MVKTQVQSATDEILGSIKNTVNDVLNTLPLPGKVETSTSVLHPGKMLRSRFAVRIAGGLAQKPERHRLRSACAAVEIVHTASLCHDDLIDDGRFRRGQPCLWRASSPPEAILTGDMLLCASIKLAMDAGAGREFLQKITETCAGETRHEMKHQPECPPTEWFIEMARGKTGPFFAFLGWFCGQPDPELATVLEETGYDIGTAYQLADDLLDATGDEAVAGKTLGLDEARGKLTLPRLPGGKQKCRRQIKSIVQRIPENLLLWPKAKDGVERFLFQDLKPVLDRFAIDVGI
ncbi:MAG: polyprenyl synthetase family protein [Planctomycetes bacterium]|nr:polyprenyl synthetase family protein [Planctomycetota bacterium]